MKTTFCILICILLSVASTEAMTLVLHERMKIILNSNQCNMGYVEVDHWTGSQSGPLLVYVTVPKHRIPVPFAVWTPEPRDGSGWGRYSLHKIEGGLSMDFFLNTLGMANRIYVDAGSTDFEIDTKGTYKAIKQLRYDCWMSNKAISEYDWEKTYTALFQLNYWERDLKEYLKEISGGVK